MAARSKRAAVFWSVFYHLVMIFPLVILHALTYFGCSLRARARERDFGKGRETRCDCERHVVANGRCILDALSLSYLSRERRKRPINPG